MGKENFTIELLSTLDELEKKQLPEELLMQMETQALEKIFSTSSFSKSALFAIAASFLFLVSVNILLTNQNLSRNMDTSQEVQSYDLIPAKSIYHE